jgi:hypothetical protein
LASPANSLVMGMNRRFAPENVKCDVVDSFGSLMEIVK